MRASFESEGELRDVDPLAALVALWREGQDGSLRFERAGALAGFDLSGGEVVGVASSDPRFETAAILVRAGKLAPEAVEKLAVPEGSDAAAVALAAGVLTRREWRWGEKIRAIEILSDLLGWPDGRYRFNRTPPGRAGEFRLPIPRLLLELFLRSRDRHLIEHQLGPADAPLTRAPRFEEEFGSFGLTADAESVARLIDGRSSAAQIAAAAPADEFAVHKLLAALVTLGLVRPTAAPHAGEREEEPAPGTSVAGAAEEAAEPFPPAERESAASPADLSAPPVSPHEIEPAPADTFDAPLDRFDESPPPVEVPPSGPEARPGDVWEDLPTHSAEPAPEEAPAPRRRSLAPLAWVLGVALAAAAVFWIVRSRDKGPARIEPTPGPALTFPPPATAAVAPARRTAPPIAGAAAPPSPAPRSAGAAAPGRAPAAALPRITARSSSPGVWDRRAERDRRRLLAERRTRYAIQLELVCEAASLEEAWKHDRGSSLWLLPAAHRGRDCFRVLWGRYPTLDAARRAKAGIPPYFVTRTNRPAVVAVK